MSDLLRWILPVYFILFFGIAFVLKSVLIAKQIGKNPMVLPNDDSAYGLVGWYFKLTLIAIFVYTMLFAFFPSLHDNFFPVTFMDKPAVNCIGIILLAGALLWTVIAQGQMKSSWRIGIDTTTKTQLVTHGLFSVSRNPIFFGMLLSLAGLFLATPNTVTLIFCILGYVLIQIQIRLEEEFLTKQHEQRYLDYKQKVRRLL